MNERSRVPATITEYLADFPPPVRAILRKIRATIAAAAPDAQEVISYRMPAFRQNGILLHFAAFKVHIGIFPPVSGDARLAKALAPYRGPKGNLRFPFDRPMPYDLIERIARLRVGRNAAMAAAGRPVRTAGTAAPKREASRSTTRGRARHRR